MFRILLVNQSEDIKYEEARRVASALDKQLHDHFYPAWSIEACVKLGNRKTTIETLKQDAIIFLRDKPDIDDAAGYHDVVEETGLPVGYVFQDIAAELDEPWSVTASHEVLELVLNRHCNYFAIGRHPKYKTKKVAHWLEACDAVQDSTYLIDRVEVSNFVHPCFFTPGQEKGGINDHLRSKKLESFSVLPGGYLGYYNPETGEDETYFADKRARQRFKVKGKMGSVRRHARPEASLVKPATSLAVASGRKPKAG